MLVIELLVHVVFDQLFKDACKMKQLHHHVASVLDA